VNVVANGTQREVACGSTVADLLRSLGLDPAHTVVELDGAPLPRERFADAVLAPGARVEIAQMVGGG